MSFANIADLVPNLVPRKKEPLKFQRFLMFIGYSSSQMSFCHYTILYRRYGSIWFYMCSTILSPRTVLNGVINLLSYFCYQSKILVIS